MLQIENQQNKQLYGTLTGANLWRKTKQKSGYILGGRVQF